MPVWGAWKFHWEGGNLYPGEHSVAEACGLWPDAP
jgi:hypothetical protein